jgi:hypothetical protein
MMCHQWGLIKKLVTYELWRCDSCGVVISILLGSSKMLKQNTDLQYLTYYDKNGLEDDIENNCGEITGTHNE